MMWLKSIKVCGIDERGQQKSNNFEALREKYEIQHEVNAPYTQQHSNMMVYLYRRNYIVLNMVRSMLKRKSFHIFHIHYRERFHNIIKKILDQQEINLEASQILGHYALNIILMRRGRSCRIKVIILLLYFKHVPNEERKKL
ncbi:hypothetical protein CR513_46841, partial [Mucuna pruriens]